jgi:hypothetical protein
MSAAGVLDALLGPSLAAGRADGELTEVYIARYTPTFMTTES